MGFTMDLGIMVPEYEVDRKWRLDQHFEGGYIFRDKINFDLSTTGGALVLKYGFDSKTPNRASKKLDALTQDGTTEFQIPITRSSKPGISSTLTIRATPWI
jgi:hypothetical protein